MNETAYALLESAENQGLIFTLSPFGSNIIISLPLHHSFCEKSIEELNLSVRSHNGLMRAGLTTVGKLKDAIMSEDGLSKIRNLGRKSISEIKTVLLAEGYAKLNDSQRLSFWHDFVRYNKAGGNGDA